MLLLIKKKRRVWKSKRNNEWRALSNPSSSYQSGPSVLSWEKIFRPAWPPIFSLSQTTRVLRDYISSQKSPQTRNSLKTESTYSRIITCDAARIFFVYILLSISSSRDSIKSMLSLSVYFFFCSSFVVSFPRGFFCFFCFFPFSRVHLDRQFLSHHTGLCEISSHYLTI